MATTNEKLIFEVQFDIQTGQSNIQKVTQQVDAARAKFDAGAKSAKEFGKNLKSTSSQAGLANTAILEMGRTISDAPYGIQGMGNNISQLATILGQMGEKAKQGGTSIKENLLGALKGPLGVIVLIQVAIAAITYFSKALSKNKEVVDDLGDSYSKLKKEIIENNDALKEQTNEVGRLTRGLMLDLDGALAMSNKSYNKYLDRLVELVGAEKVFNDEGQVTLDILIELNKEFGKLENAALGYTEAIRDEATLDEISKILGLTTKVQDIENEIDINIKKLAAKTGKSYDESLIEYYNSPEGRIMSAKRIAAQTKIDDDAAKEEAARVAKRRAEIEEEIEDIVAQQRKRRRDRAKRGGVIEEFYGEGISAPDGEEVAKQLKKSLEPVDDVINESKEGIKGLTEYQLEGIETGLKLAAQGIGHITDIMNAEAERQITIETNKTNAINDQLRQRLANENLSAEERDKINQQIAQNEINLVKKENEINKKRFYQEKAANISMAIINTALAATGVLKDTKGGTFARIAGMIAVIGAGLAQVAVIAKSKFQAKALPTASLSAQGGGFGSGQPQAPEFNVLGSSGQNQLAETIARTQKTPIKTYVVAKDVTTAQELDRNIIVEAGI